MARKGLRPPLTTDQRALFRKSRSKPVPPTHRAAAPALPALSPAESAQERIEEHRMRQDWRKDT